MFSFFSVEVEGVAHIYKKNEYIYLRSYSVDTQRWSSWL